MTQVRYFAAAAEAAGTHAETLDAGTMAELRAQMVRGHGPQLERVLERCALLVSGRRVDDPHAPVTDADVVDVLPPFAGG